MEDTPGNAYYVAFTQGKVGFEPTTEKLYVRCVQKLPIPCDIEQKWPVTPTGQNKCYGASGEIACRGEGQAFYGQDAQYSDNTRIFNIYDVAGNTVVEDSLTGLMWQKGFATGIQNWPGAIEHCLDLNYAGFNDWRLPNPHEVLSLANYGKLGPASDFPDMPDNLILPTSGIESLNSCISVDSTTFSTMTFLCDSSSYLGSSKAYSVLCVRLGETKKRPRDLQYPKRYPKSPW